jgi:SNF2 family DNA or RNA helicase
MIYKEKYIFPKHYTIIYENISDFLYNLNLPHLQLINKSGNMLAGLFKIMLFKRLESSIFSFMKSLYKLRDSEINFLNEIKKSGLYIAISKMKEDSTFIPDLVQDQELDEWLIDHNEDNESYETDNKLNYEKTIKLIEQDLNSIQFFYKKFLPLIKRNPHYKWDKGGEYSFEDPKLDRLKTIVDKNKTKILIFSQYIDTVEYLFFNLKQFAFEKKLKIDCITGGENTKLEIGSNMNREMKILFFAPRSNGYELDEDDKEIDILISTDAISEGVNLQDCSLIINYDLPWNPMKIVQRVGRIDRIGNQNRVSVYNIFPDGELDALLNLIEKLNTKIENISNIIGKENYILSEDEMINPKIIGEKIKNIREPNNFYDYENINTNPLLSQVGKSEEKGAQIVELKYILSKLGIVRSDFKRYDIPVYSIMNSEYHKGIFCMYRIFDKTKSLFENEGKIENIIYYKDFKTNEIKQLNTISDLGIQNVQLGIPKDDHNIKYRLDNELNELHSYFENTILSSKRDSYKKTKMRYNLKYSKIQGAIIDRLSSLTQQKLLDNQKLDYEKIKFLHKEFTTKPLEHSTIERLKYNYLSNSKNVNSEHVIQNIYTMNNMEFVNKTNSFYEREIKDNPHYSDLIDPQNISYKVICWGAFI